jgi:DNA invertase Pin-like site-specific DNA recombinase
MNQRVAIYVLHTRSQLEPVHALRQAVESRGATVAGTFSDDPQNTGRGKYAGWRNLIKMLDEVDQLVVSTVGDLPGRTVAEFLKTLGILRDHHVGLYLYDEDIDTGGRDGFMLLELVAAHRRAKLSQSIRNGQAKAMVAGRRIGRPKVPRRIRDGILTALANGNGIRPTARQFNVSPASVINIRRAMTVSSRNA